MSIEFDELSNRVIRSAIEVHKKLGPGFLQLLSYLKATGIKIGLLLNFAKATLEIKRVVS